MIYPLKYHSTRSQRYRFVNKAKATAKWPCVQIQNEATIANRVRKRAYRAKISEAQKQLVRIYDATRIAKKRKMPEEIRNPLKQGMNEKAAQGVTEVPCKPKKDAHKLNSWLRTKMAAMRKYLPDSPRKRTLVMTNLHRSPSLVTVNTNSIARDAFNIGAARKSSSKEKLQETVNGCANKYGSIKSCSEMFGIPQHTLRRWSTRKAPGIERESGYTWRVTDDMKNEITAFYKSPQIGLTMPDAKYAGKYFLKFSLREAHRIYLKSNSSTRKVCFAKFCALRPRKEVQLEASTPHRQCVCEVCENLRGYITTARSYNLQGIGATKRDAIDATMCSYGHLGNDNVDIRFKIAVPKLSCASRTCADCGTGNLLAALLEANKTVLTDTVRWRKWQTEKVIKKGKEVMKLIHTQEETTVANFIEVIVTALTSISLHMFNSAWQYQQFVDTLRHLGDHQILIVHDFAQNYLNILQDEPQGVHWQHEQTTIHASVVYYHCKASDSCSSTVHHEVVHIGKDMHHDFQAAKVYRNGVIQHLQDLGLSFSEVIEFTDQAPQHFKNCNVFNEISEAEIAWTRHFYATRHGKATADALVSRVKQLIRHGVRTRQCTGEDAHDVYLFLKRHDKPQLLGYCRHHLLYFFWIPEISRSKAHAGIKTIPETRKFHCVKSCGQPGVVMVRYHSCGCPTCCSGKGTKCSNEICITGWMRKVVNKVTSTMPNGNPAPRSARGQSTPCNSRSANGKVSRRSGKQPSSIIPPPKAYCTRSGRNGKGSSSLATPTNPHSTRSARKAPSSIAPTTHPYSTRSATNGKASSSKQPSHLGRNGNSCGTSTHSNDKANNPYWRGILGAMRNLSTFAELNSYAESLPLPQMQPSLDWRMGLGLSVDATALCNMPKDSPEGLAPVTTGGDGNCFMRAASVVMFGSEERHEEIRVRIVFEAVLKKKLYLMETALGVGAVHTYTRGTLAQQYAQYTGIYLPAVGRAYDDVGVELIYEADVMKIRESGEWCGIWQFHQLSNIVGRPIQSVYPEGVNANVRKDLHRTVFPKNKMHHQLRPISIMWTPTVHRGGVNHFVPLMIPHP